MLDEFKTKEMCLEAVKRVHCFRDILPNHIPTKFKDKELWIAYVKRNGYDFLENYIKDVPENIENNLLSSYIEILLKIFEKNKI